MAHVLADLVEGRLGQHPALPMDAEWVALAQRAADALQNLYQAIGAAHLDKTESGDLPSKARWSPSVGAKSFCTLSNVSLRRRP